MSILNEKVAYLKGLLEGLQIDDSTKEGKVLNVITDILSEMALDLEETIDSQDELYDAVCNLEDEVEDMHSILMDDEDCDCDCCTSYEPDELTVECPSCNNIVDFDNDDIDEDGFIVCPYCDEEIEIEFDEDDEEK